MSNDINHTTEPETKAFVCLACRHVCEQDDDGPLPEGDEYCSHEWERMSQEEYAEWKSL